MIPHFSGNFSKRLCSYLQIQVSTKKIWTQGFFLTQNCLLIFIRFSNINDLGPQVSRTLFRTTLIHNFINEKRTDTGRIPINVPYFSSNFYRLFSSQTSRLFKTCQWVRVNPRERLRVRILSPCGQTKVRVELERSDIVMVKKNQWVQLEYNHVYSLNLYVKKSLAQSKIEFQGWTLKCIYVNNKDSNNTNSKKKLDT